MGQWNAEILARVSDAADEPITLLIQHVRVLEKAIEECVGALAQKDGGSVVTETLRCRIKERIESWLTPDSDHPEVPLLYSNWMHDWLYPSAEASHESMIKVFRVYTPTGDLRVEAVSIDSALHRATVAFIGHDIGERSNTGYAAAYHSYRSRLEAREVVTESVDPRQLSEGDAVREQIRRQSSAAAGDASVFRPATGEAGRRSTS